jgi:hypothetical protein
MKEDKDYLENKKLIYDLNDILTKLLTKEAVSEDDYEFAKHLLTYFHQILKNCFDLGLGRAMLPIASIVVWYGMAGPDKKEFVYRLSTIGGQPYVELNLQRVAQLLQDAVVQWADENWDGVIDAQQENPMWVIDTEEEKVK